MVFAVEISRHAVILLLTFTVSTALRIQIFRLMHVLMPQHFFQLSGQKTIQLHVIHERYTRGVFLIFPIPQHATVTSEHNMANHLTSKLAI